MKKPILPLMLKDLPFSKDELQALLATAPYRYKVYKIPKRKPNEFRTIAQPTPEIKLIQRWFVDNIFSKLPVHPAATAYREGISIAKHAETHAARRFLLKMDFKNFFPSIRSADVEQHLRTYGKLTADQAKIISHFVCWRDRTSRQLCLSIGAPSSPMLSNTILIDFDRQISAIARQKKVRYSRYADDLAFSTNQSGVLSEMESEVKRVCAQLAYPKLTVNDDKTVFTSRQFRRVLVGLVLTPSGVVSLGRDKKRRLRSELFRFSQGKLDDEYISKLRGELAYAWSIEPDYIRTLIRQRGVEILEKLGLPFR